MGALSLILTSTLAHFFAVISPGPDFVVAVKNSLQYSRKTGIWTALGFALGILVHVSYCMAGIAVLITQSEWIFNIVKISGGVYLLYMGYQSLSASVKKISFDTVDKVDIPWYQGLKIGFITNVLNPKATLFFLSIFTVLFTPGTPVWVTFTAGFIMVVNTFLWFSIVSYLFTQKKIRNTYMGKLEIINKILGVVLIAFGLFVIWF